MEPDKFLPHPALTEHYSSTEGKPAFVNRLFDAGAKYYDGVVEWGFLRSGSFYRRSAQGRHELKPGDHVLDVGCGTGLMAVEAMKILGTAENITCLDPSEGMLAVARTKLPAKFVQGRAERMPFDENSFDFLTMGYALRHVTSLEATFREYHRVLRPGGKVLILEITKPSGQVGNFFFPPLLRSHLPGVNAALHPQPRRAKHDALLLGNHGCLRAASSGARCAPGRRLCRRKANANARFVQRI
jgi:demethylmenaquinone methyltransferase/2-methoxy-6-polyprenyl-1,4-benzoquinol methylase